MNNKIFTITIIFLVISVFFIALMLYSHPNATIPTTVATSDVVQYPIISNVYTDPTDVIPGDKMLVSVDAKDPSGIKSVIATMPHELGVDTLPLHLTNGDKLNGTWQGTWTVHDTLDKGYTTTVTATNEQGVQSQSQIYWTDPAVAPGSCDWGNLDNSSYNTTVGSTVSVSINSMGSCGTISLQDNTTGSYALIPNTDADIDCNGISCDNLGSGFQTRNIKCESAGTYSIKGHGTLPFDSAVSTVTCIAADVTAPINSATVVTTGSNSSAVAWTTDEAGSSIVEYGLTNSYTASTTEADTSPRVTSHSESLSNLPACTTYHHRVRSKDLAQNEGVGSDATFTTSGCTGATTIATSTASTITASDGGTVTLLNTSGQNLTLTIPTDFTATSSSVTFQAKELDPTSFISTTGSPTGLSLISTPYNLSAYSDATTTLSTFTKPLDVTIPYTHEMLGNIPETSLVIQRYDVDTGWTPLTSCSVDASANTVTCQTTHFSDFAIFGQTVSGSNSTTSSITRSSGGTFHYGCKDPQATNYEYFAASRPTLCKYTTLALADISTTTTKSSSTLFTRDLTFKTNHSQVKLLQQYLNQNGFTVSSTGAGSLGNETNYFGSATRAALIKFQKANNIKPSVGYFGAITRRFISTH